MIKACVLASLAFAAAAVFAQNPRGVAVPLPVTMAWRHLVAPSGSSTQAGQMAVDAQGYNYIFYTTQGFVDPYTAFLLKLGPANSIEFIDEVNDFAPPSTFIPNAAVVTPKIAGQQFVYAVGTEPLGGNLDFWKFDTSGNFLTGANLSAASNQTFIAAAASANGHLMVVTRGVNGGLNETIYYDCTPTGSVTSVVDPSIDPQAAQYYAPTNSWFVTGLLANDPTGLGAAWRSGDATTGATHYGGSLSGSGTPGTGPYTKFRFYADLLPGGHFALTMNETDNDGAGNNSSHFLIDYEDMTGTPLWTYPPAFGDVAGTVSQVVQYNTSSPLYVMGAADTGPAGFPLQFLISLAPNGAANYTETQSPLTRLYPMVDGFWDLFYWPNSNSTFLEHFFGGDTVFTWGKQYAGSSNDSGADFLGRLTQFQNFIYGSFNNSSGIFIDRFVTGTALSSVSMPANFTAGNTVIATITLNRAVQTGESLWVALNSNSPNVLMPNGTQAQNFTFTAGQTSQNITLTTTVGASSVQLLAIQNGIRRTTTSTAL